MNRFERIDLITFEENLIDNLNDEMTKIRESVANNINEFSRNEEIFWSGVYSGYLQNEEFIFSITDTPENEESTETILTENIQDILNKISDLLHDTRENTYFIVGFRYILLHFRRKFAKINTALENDDFEAFHTALTTLIPEVNEEIGTDGNWLDDYFDFLDEEGINPEFDMLLGSEN